MTEFNLTPSSTADLITLSAGDAALQWRGPGCGLSALRFAGQAPFAGVAADLYSLELTAPDGEKRVVGSSEAETCERRLEAVPAGARLVLAFTHRPDAADPAAAIHVTCVVTLAASGRSEWRIAVENRTPYAIQRVTYPMVRLARRALDPAAPRFDYPYDRTAAYASALLLGWWDGMLVPEPYESIPDGFGWAEEHPGRAAAQLVAYYDTAGGLCLHTEDGTGYPKRLGFCRAGDTLDIGPAHLFPRLFGADVAPAYPVVLAPFRGDWQAAAGVYKRWALAQEWTRQTLDRRSDVPDWVKAGLPFFLHIQARPTPPDHDERWRQTQPRAAAPVLRAYAQILGTPIVDVVFGWEKHCSWITPDVFPTYPSDAEMGYLISSLKESGSRVFFFNSGTRWAVKNPRDPSWDGTAHWEQAGRAASCVGEDGAWSYDARPWAVNHKLCVAAAGTRQMMDDYAAGFAALGLDATQYDQNLGGEAYVCYSPNHGHPPGYGRWMYDETRRILRRFNEQSRRRNPGFAASVEEPSEILIPDLAMYDSRGYIYHGWPLLTNMPCLGVPLFSFLYHEYIPAFAGDLGLALEGEGRELVQIGRALHAGWLPEGIVFSEAFGYSRIRDAVLAGRDFEGPVPPALALLKNASAALRTYAHDWAVFGRMLAEPRCEVDGCFELRKAVAQSYYNDDRVAYVHPEAEGVRVPVVFANAWASPEGVPACLFTNMSERRQRVRLSVSSLGDEWRPYLGSPFALENLEGCAGMVAPAGDLLELDLPALQVSVLRPAR